MKKTTLTHIILLLIVLSTSVALGGEENADVATRLRALIEQRRDTGREIKISIRITDEELKASDPQQILALLAEYEKDPSKEVRRLAYLYSVKFAHLHPVPNVRRKVSTRLVDALFDSNSGVGGHICTWLLSFVEKDFTDQSKAKIRQALEKRGPRVCLIQICGVANIQTALPYLKELLIDEIAYSKRTGEKWRYTVGWKARLARARMGVKEDIEKCIDLVDTVENEDDKVLRLLHQVGYIRQPEAIKYLEKYLYSDGRLPSLVEGGPGEPYKKYVINILAESLVNFPLKRREARGHKQHEIEFCREWMAKQTKWKIRR